MRFPAYAITINVYSTQLRNYDTRVYFLPAVTLAQPELNDLIAKKRRDGQGTLHITDFIATHSDAMIDDFAHLLLKDPVAIQGLHNDNKEKTQFVRAVLRKWIRDVSGPAVPRTWESLVEVMKNAGLDGLGVQDIENDVCGK